MYILKGIGVESTVISLSENGWTQIKIDYPHINNNLECTYLDLRRNVTYDVYVILSFRYLTSKLMIV
jgi:hypothetical protein